LPGVQPRLPNDTGNPIHLSKDFFFPTLHCLRFVQSIITLRFTPNSTIPSLSPFSSSYRRRRPASLPARLHVCFAAVRRSLPPPRVCSAAVAAPPAAPAARLLRHEGCPRIAAANAAYSACIACSACVAYSAADGSACAACSARHLLAPLPPPALPERLRCWPPHLRRRPPMTKKMGKC